MSRLFQKFRTDIAGIALVGAGLFVGLSLLSFHPADPSLNSIGHNLKVLNYCGYVGSFLADILFQLFGVSAWLISFGLLRTAVVSLQGGTVRLKNIRFIWGMMLVFTLSSLCSVYFPNMKIYQEQVPVGGLLGLGISQGLIRAFNSVGVQIILWSLAAVLVVFFSEKTVHELAELPLRAWKTVLRFGLKAKLRTFFASQGFKARKKQRDTKEPESSHRATTFLPLKAEKEDSNFQDPEEIEDQVAQQMTLNESLTSTAPTRRKVVMKARPQRRIENWVLPKLSLLEDPPVSRFKIDQKEIQRKADILKDKLARFGITGEVVAARPGPAVTMFEFKPSADVKVSKITDLENDLSMSLSSESLRILAPIPGRDVVGIETSNAQRETVYLKDLLADENFWSDDLKLPIALGKQANGEPKIVDLRKMPHLMVAGTTGSGKSVFTVSVITGLIFKHSPKTLRLIMIDPKQVDLAAFSEIPHLVMPPIVDSKQAVSALRWAVREMEKRYKSMQKFSSRGLEQFNETVANLSKEQIEEHEKALLEMESNPSLKLNQYYCTPQPYIVVVIEEFGDLMTVDKANVETSIVRLAQKARACGIHLLLAMQSPRKEVVTGLIKTNIPGRISFKVNSSMDSRIILDETGAERLLAQGDMLFKNPGGPNSVRHHGPFLKDAEINGVAKFWSDQAQPEYDVTAMKALEGFQGDGLGAGEDGFGENSDQDYDERYDEILSWASAQKAISASLIQRRFQLGYPRAARMIETFEREGVVGPANGSKPRQVLVNNLANLE
jgi:DNA segregation ATPase FtsK/SpoIIIE, S-DNA-T family